MQASTARVASIVYKPIYHEITQTIRQTIILIYCNNCAYRDACIM